MSTTGPTLELDTESLGALHWLVVGTALVSAVVHLYLGLLDLGGFFGTSFLVATAGFVAGVVAILVNYRRRLVYLLGIPYTATQIVLWFALNQPIPPISTAEVVDKTAQVVLVVALVSLYRRGDDGD